MKALKLISIFVLLSVCGFLIFLCAVLYQGYEEEKIRAELWSLYAVDSLAILNTYAIGKKISTLKSDLMDSINTNYPEALDSGDTGKHWCVLNSIAFAYDSNGYVTTVVPKTESECP